MKRGKRPELLWGLGLTEVEKSRIEHAVGPGFFLRNFTEQTLPGTRDIPDEDKPTVAWIPWRVWRTLSEQRKEAYREHEDIPRILIEDEKDGQITLEEVLEQGFLTAIRTPLTKVKVQDSLFRAKEVVSLYSDIYRMTEEIFLERELLARKTDQLLFLNKLLARSAESLDAAAILTAAREDLQVLLPVSAMQAVFWRKEEQTGLIEAEVFVHAGLEPPLQELWVEHLLEQAVKTAGAAVQSFRLTFLDQLPAPSAELVPKPGNVASFPLVAAGQAIGCLNILSPKALRLAKDQTQTLSAAVNCLALALRNALLFTEVKHKADRDALTRIYNRQTFDSRLMEELSRHQRYRHHLTLLMLDLDHFKAINDTYGHQMGDTVLQETARILQASLRGTDFAARYGGEEFVVLLPHTSADQATILAERIRSKIAGKNFNARGKRFRVTASIGLASLTPGALDREADLVLKVDQALYQAKANGRNMVVVAKEPAPALTLAQ